MISAGEFRNGVTFEQDGQVLQVVEFQHVKPGKGAAFVRTKTKNVITGSVVETSYNPTAKFPQAFIERKDVTYSYEDGDLYHFMDNETYDDIFFLTASGGRMLIELFNHSRVAFSRCMHMLDGNIEIYKFIDKPLYIQVLT